MVLPPLSPEAWENISEDIFRQVIASSERGSVVLMVSLASLAAIERRAAALGIPIKRRPDHVPPGWT